MPRGAGGRDVHAQEDRRLQKPILRAHERGLAGRRPLGLYRFPSSLRALRGDGLSKYSI